MPMRLTVEKEYQGEFWTNVYWLNVANPPAGNAAAEAVVNAERSTLDNRCIITRYRIDDAVPLTDNYHTVVLNVTGASANATIELMPLFSVVRVDLTVAGSRPSRKYFRGYLLESIVEGPFNISASAITSFQTNLADALAAIPELCDVDGQDVVGAKVWPKVAMRQLRRGSKKKVTQSTTTTA